VTWDTNQWVSYDDTQTLKMKMEYANGKCIGGYVRILWLYRLALTIIFSVLVWAADLDDQTGSAINALGAALELAPRTVFPALIHSDTGPDLGTLKTSGFTSDAQAAFDAKTSRRSRVRRS
jgi:hypothetical protein